MPRMLLNDGLIRIQTPIGNSRICRRPQRINLRALHLEISLRKRKNAISIAKKAWKNRVVAQNFGQSEIALGFHGFPC